MTRLRLEPRKAISISDLHSQEGEVYGRMWITDLKTLSEVLLMLTNTAPFGGLVMPVAIVAVMGPGSNRSNWRNCIVMNSYSRDGLSLPWVLEKLEQIDSPLMRRRRRGGS